MDDLCRLCCSAKFVNNYIFDEENALFLKMSLYLPIKVFKNDRLPQKVCDKCSCKVNDFYQFCNEAIEVQNRLKGILPSLTHNESIGHSIIKGSNQSPPTHTFCHQATQTNENDTFTIQVKNEPQSDSPLDIKSEQYDDDNNLNDVPSKGSEDEFLVEIKKKPGKDNVFINGEKKESRKGKKRKTKQESEFGDGYPDNVIDLDLVKEEVVVVKRKTKEYLCCICSEKSNTKLELLNHYKYHGTCASSPAKTPPPPPPPAGNTQRCMRCQKAVSGGAAGWAEHWRRHYALDTRPLRCGLCAHTFRDPYLILKHGLTHREEIEQKGGKEGKEGEGGESALTDKRFLCDICPEAFSHLRFLLAHRTRSHPEAAAALRLRCGLCARSFAHINSLRRHLRGHTGERNYLCNVCGKALSSREHLTFHIRIHTGYKPHVCKVCGKGFVKKCNLTLHERVHTGEKPHVCPHCGKAFSQRSTLVIHERYHSGARPYTCALCGRGFVAKGLLSMHLKSTCVELPQSRPPLKKKSPKLVGLNREEAHIESPISD